MVISNSSEKKYYKKLDMAIDELNLVKKKTTTNDPQTIASFVTKLASLIANKLDLSADEELLKIDLQVKQIDKVNFLFNLGNMANTKLPGSILKI
jgi:hypothetical protein